MRKLLILMLLIWGLGHIAQAYMLGTDPKNFYLHDRLASVRQVIDADEDVVARYTYDPYGNALETDENGVTNPYRFADYWWDEELHQYFCNARWYDPRLTRFTGRDPERGEFSEPLTLHVYLYCGNDPLDRVDPAGLKYYNADETSSIMARAARWVTYGKLVGSIAAFGFYPDKSLAGYFDFKVRTPVDTFQAGSALLTASEFGNYLAGYANRVGLGDFGVGCTFLAGDAFELSSNRTLDDSGSRFYIQAGVLQASRDNLGVGSLTGILGIPLNKVGLWSTFTDYAIDLLDSGSSDFGQALENYEAFQNAEWKVGRLLRD